MTHIHPSRRRALRLAALVATALSATALPVTAQAQDLSIGLSGNVTSMDPHFHNLSPNSNVAAHVYDRLVHHDERQRMGPGLALSWTAIDDLTWEFKLRPGVRFHDGSEFGAEDVVATLKRVPWVPNSPSPFTLYTRAIVATEIQPRYTLTGTRASQRSAGPATTAVTRTYSTSSVPSSPNISPTDSSIRSWCHATIQPMLSRSDTSSGTPAARTKAVRSRRPGRTSLARCSASAIRPT